MCLFVILCLRFGGANPWFAWSHSVCCVCASFMRPLQMHGKIGDQCPLPHCVVALSLQAMPGNGGYCPSYPPVPLALAPGSSPGGIFSGASSSFGNLGNLSAHGSQQDLAGETFGNDLVALRVGQVGLWDIGTG